MSELQDLVILGGGAGGFAAAMRAAQLGGKVTLIEKAHHGGNCMNRACIPLTFLALAVPTIKDRFTGMAALIAGVVAVLAYGAPFKTGLVIASLAGILAGMIFERWAK